MVITKHGLDRVLEMASRVMLDEWLPSHHGVVDETERHISRRKIVFASENEHDVWMMWLALSTRGYSVYVHQSSGHLEVRKKLTKG